MNLRRKAETARNSFKTSGWRGIEWRLRHNIVFGSQKRNYQKWIRLYDTLTDKDRNEIRVCIEDFNYKPLISVLMPVYNVDEKWLRLAIESVRKQIYTNWEFCIADDKSPKPHIRRVLEEYAALDSRFKIVFREQNGHISAASNSALDLATGEFCALLDHDDELSEHALYFVANEINHFPETDVIYSDEDLIDQKGRRHEPKFKPDWSPDFFYSLNLVTHLSVYRTEILRKIDGFRTGVEGSQDYDLALRVIEQIPETHIRHIPHILYHWRAIPGSVALGINQKDYAPEAARRAISQHFQRVGVAAQVEETFGRLHRVVYSLPSPGPLATLILVADENAATSSETIKNLLTATDYPYFEILLVGENQSFADSRVKTLTENFPNAAQAQNSAAQKANGEVLVFIDEKLKPKNSDWLREMVSHALRQQIGAVGAKLLYPNDTIEHAGYILGIKGTVGNANHHLPNEFSGYFIRAKVINNFLAVSGACLATRRELFDQIGGFDAKNLPNKFYDVDFCLRLGKKGFRTVWSPYAELVWKKSASKEKILNFVEEEKYFKMYWSEVITRDPFYNPNLSLANEDFSLLLPRPEGLLPYKTKNI
jgi:GT2 family glycosyltransferase